jgi:hypothetical protein
MELHTLFRRKSAAETFLYKKQITWHVLCSQILAKNGAVFVPESETSLAGRLSPGRFKNGGQFKRKIITHPSRPRLKCNLCISGIPQKYILA